MDYYERAGLIPYLDKLGFNLVGFGCTTCIGNSGPLPPEISAAVNDDGLAVVSVLSGNRNFEGRINADVRMNYLASPPLVVAYALAGTMDIDLYTEPLGTGADGEPVFLRGHLADHGRGHRGRAVVAASRTCSGPPTAGSSRARTAGGNCRPRPAAATPGSRSSTYVRQPPYFVDLPDEPAPLTDIAGARVLAVLGDSVTTDHISPAGSIHPDSPAGRYLIEQGVERADFNSYGSRRGNHEVMIRGTFANRRIRNRLAAGTEGGVTRHLPDGETHVDLRRRHALRRRRRAAGDPGRQGVRVGLVAGLGGQGHDAARRAGRPGRELRADPPLQPHRHGRAAAAVRRRRLGRVARPHRARRRSPSPAWPAPNPSRSSAGRPDGRGATGEPVEVVLRIDTPMEAEYLRHGGILPYVLRQHLASAGQ